MKIKKINNTRARIVFNPRADERTSLADIWSVDIYVVHMCVLKNITKEGALLYETSLRPDGMPFAYAARYASRGSGDAKPVR